jgi:hypothetical protein
VLSALWLPAGCVGDELAPSVWPPADFECVVEEISFTDGRVDVVRRVRFTADGIVVYGTSSDPLTCTVTGAPAVVSLPVFDRLCIYELVPTCVRAFARRIDRLGILELGDLAGDIETASPTSLSVRWRAMGQQKSLLVRGRVHGPIAEILRVVTAHLPPGETFGLAGLAERPPAAVLRGVPEPRLDAAGAMAAYTAVLTGRPRDPELLLEGFALACRSGSRRAAADWLAAWTQATAGERPAAATGPVLRDRLGTLEPETLRQFLPAD